MASTEEVTTDVSLPTFMCPQIAEALRPRNRVVTWDWICENGRDQYGYPFDGDRVPWLRGVCEAFDDPGNRTIVLQWGTRLGKTMVCLMIIMCVMRNSPKPGMLASSRQKLIERIVKSKLYKMLAATPGLKEQLKTESRRAAHSIDLTYCQWAVAWSGSESMLADWSAAIIYANEIDKWDTDASSEGDSLAQMLERVKDRPKHKILLECSPTIRKRSRIEQRYESSNRCLYWVRCRHCGKHQVLKMGDGKGTLAGGLFWDHLPDGHSDPELSRTTARYMCEHCHGETHDEDRAKMMRSGLWVPAGCGVNQQGGLTGTALRGNRIWGGKLPSLYSLQMRWGDIAEKFVQSKSKPRLLQMFVNGWMAETWEVHRQKTEPEELSKRICLDSPPRGTIPDGFTWVSAAVDVQDTYFVYWVSAFAPGEREHLVEWGYCDTWEEVFRDVISRTYDHEDGKEPLGPSITLIDSGDGLKTREVYKKCREWNRPGRMVLPCKGASTDLGGEAYKVATIGDGTKTGSKYLKRKALRTRGVVRVDVNKFFWEPETQKQLDALIPGEPESLSLPPEAAADADLLEQILNGVQSHEPSKRNPNLYIWIKRDENEPNDLRDSKIYARCGIEAKFRGDWSKAERRQIPYQEDESAPERRPANAKMSTTSQSGRRAFRVKRTRKTN